MKQERMFQFQYKKGYILPGQQLSLWWKSKDLLFGEAGENLSLEYQGPEMMATLSATIQPPECCNQYLQNSNRLRALNAKVTKNLPLICIFSKLLKNICH
jgi:hypothetical protein